MGFALPAVLLAALAVALPVWVHLAFKPHEAGRRLPSLMFLEAEELKVRRNRQLRDRLLLALRVLLMLLLVAAFAGPFTDLTDGERVTRAPAVVVLDQSASMGIEQRWPEAVERARSVLSATDRQVALLGAAHATTELTPFGAARDERLASLASLTPRMERGDLGAALQHAVTWLQRNAREQGQPEVTPGQVVIVSDLQESAVTQASLSAVPDNIRIRVERVGRPDPAEPAAPNVSIETMRVRDGTNELEITLRNTGRVDAGGRELLVKAGEHPVAQELVSLKAGESRIVSVPVTRAPDRSVVLSAALNSDALTYDNQHAIVLSPTRTHRVGLLGSGALGPIQRAAFESMRRPAVAVVGEATPDRVRNRQLDLVYIEGLGAGRADLALDDFVRSGGVVVALLDTERGYARLAETLGRKDSAPWPPGEEVRQQRIDADSASPRLHETARVLGSLGSSHGLAFEATAGDPALLYWEDGRAAAFVRNLGRGSVAVVGLSSARGVLARRPELAPMLRALLGIALAEEAGRAAYAPGDVVERPSGAALLGDSVVVAPDGTQRVLKARRELVAPASPGVYTVTSALTSGRWRFAVRPDIRESALEPLSEAAFQQLIASATVPTDVTLTAVPSASERVSWAWLLLIAATLAAAAELIAAIRRPSATADM